MAEEERAVEFVYHNLTVFGDGSSTRSPYQPPLLPPSSSLEDVATKDLSLSSSHGTWLRLFLPPSSTSSSFSHHKLPILLYFHGGGFLNFSTAFFMYHSFLSKLAVHSRSLIVSVEYRLAPEHPLPAAYDDCFAALAWLNEQARPGCSSADPWLANHGDFSKCFLVGDSAGGNIVHHVAMAALGQGSWRKDGEEIENAGHELECVSLEGMILIHPFFTCGASVTFTSPIEVGVWKQSGVTEHKAHPFGNPFSLDSVPLRSVPLPRALVAVGGMDALKNRGIAYHQGLVEAGKTAKLFITENEDHCFFLPTPQSENMLPFLDELRSFIQNVDCDMP